VECKTINYFITDLSQRNPMPNEISKVINFVLSSILIACPVYAQELQKPLPNGAKLIIEYSTEGKLSGFSNTVNWGKIEQAEAVLKRSTNGALIEIETSNGKGFVVFLPSYFSHPITQHSAQANVSSDRVNTSPPIQGENWQGKMNVTASVPVNWCADLMIKSEAKFEVLADVEFKLKVKGNEQTLKVTPVLENGTWQRCYSAKRTPKLLWSKELEMPLSLEWTNWSIERGLSATAFKINIKSIE
jgi:hypothetical protein